MVAMTLFSCSCNSPVSRPVQPDVQENRFRILKDAYESFNRGDMAAAVVAMDPKVEWVEPPEFPGGDRPYRGPKEVMEYLANSRAGWEQGRSDPERLIPAGDKVVVFVHARFRRRGRAEWDDVRLADVYTFRGLVIVAMNAFASRDDALKFAGVTAKLPLGRPLDNRLSRAEPRRRKAAYQQAEARDPRSSSRLLDTQAE
jgi:ketosteroid isomerase-like protein